MLEKARALLGRRAAAILLTLLAELLLVLALLTLSPSIINRKEADLTVFSIAPEAEPNTPEEQPPAPAQAETREPQPQPPTPEPPQPAPPTELPPPVIPLPPTQMAAADIAKLPPPSQPRRAVMGPADTGNPGDSQRVGQAPNGEPLYAAAWYREPYDNELRGYLSTASGPGWGLIACRTVPDYRVEDCVSLGESPEGSQIARAVLAAAWQFRVRPPRVGGRSKVGEWVRIRIDYQQRRRQ